MARNLTTATAAEIEKNQVRIAMFLQVTFKSETCYLSTLPCNFTWGGNTWTGTGSLGKVSSIEEGIDVEARGITVSLSGIDQTLLGEALTDIKVGADARLYVGFFDAQANLIDTPTTIFAGIVDQPSISVDPAGGTSTISLKLESSLIRLQRACNLQYTDSDQRADYPDDSGMWQVSALSFQALNWG